MNRMGNRLAVAAIVSVMVAGCGSGSTPSFLNKGPDLGKVLDRTAKALGSYQNYLKKLQVSSTTDAHVSELTGLFRQVLNMNPSLYHNPIGIKLRKDASFLGFDDRNDNNVRDNGEKKLFKVEIDYHGRRLIASNERESTAVRPTSGGFFVGILMTNFASRQRAAGVDRKAFANRATTPLRSARAINNSGDTRSARASGMRRVSARSRARSGGVFGGK